MRIRILTLLVLLGLSFIPMCCVTPDGETDWVAISQGVDLAAQDVHTLADLSIAEDVRYELVKISNALALAAPLLAQGEELGTAADALDTAYALCEALLDRQDLDVQARDILILTKIAIGHARRYAE